MFENGLRGANFPLNIKNIPRGHCIIVHEP
jgi:hypothetical protein